MPKTGIELIAEERLRQINVEGWTPEHDKRHYMEELARVASLYAMPKDYRETFINIFVGNMANLLFPITWSLKWWKPTPENRIKELTKAGALIAAEIDRLQTNI